MATACRLLQLPRELLDQIYLYALPHCYSADGASACKWERGNLSLMCTNRQVYGETKDLWWESNTFEVVLSGTSKWDTCLQITYDEPDQDVVETSIPVHLRPQNILLIRKWNVIGDTSNQKKWKFTSGQMEPHSYELCNMVGPRIDYATLKIPLANIEFLSWIREFFFSFPLALLQKLTHVEGKPGEHFHAVVLQAAIRNRIEAILGKPVSEPSVEQVLTDEYKRRIEADSDSSSGDDSSDWEEEGESTVCSSDEDSSEDDHPDDDDTEGDVMYFNAMLDAHGMMDGRPWL